MISSLVVTSEDRSASAEVVVDALLRKAMWCEGRALPPRRVVPADIRELTKAAMWRAKGSKTAAARLVTLVRYLASELEKGDTAVAFHFDADCAWPTTSEARADFDRLRTRVEQRLGTERATLVGRLVPIIAYWCIESWTYQHTSEAAAICREPPADEPSAKHFEAIDSDRAALERFRPHTDERYATLGRKHNHRLATHAQFPAQKTLEVVRSFATAVRGLADVMGAGDET